MLILKKIVVTFKMIVFSDFTIIFLAYSLRFVEGVSPKAIAKGLRFVTTHVKGKQSLYLRLLKRLSPDHEFF